MIRAVDCVEADVFVGGYHAAPRHAQDQAHFEEGRTNAASKTTDPPVKCCMQRLIKLATKRSDKKQRQLKIKMRVNDLVRLIIVPSSLHMLILAQFLSSAVLHTELPV